METSASRIEPGRVIGEAFQTYRDQVSAILGGALIVIGITSVINNLLGLTDSVILIFAGLIVALIGQVLYTGYVVKLVQDVRDGRRDHTMDELFSAAAPYVSTLILNGFVYAVAVFFGFLALIVPGLILITIWAVVAPSIVVEDKGVFEAFGRSRELVRGNGWRVFGTIVLAFLIVVVVAGGLRRDRRVHRGCRQGDPGDDRQRPRRAGRGAGRRHPVLRLGGRPRESQHDTTAGGGAGGLGAGRVHALPAQSGVQASASPSRPSSFVRVSISS